MSSYHDQMKNKKLPPWDLGRESMQWNQGYDAGAQQCRQALCQIAKQADAELAKVREELEEARGKFSDSAAKFGKCHDRLDAANEGMNPTGSHPQLLGRINIVLAELAALRERCGALEGAAKRLITASLAASGSSPSQSDISELDEAIAAIDAALRPQDANTDSVPICDESVQAKPSTLLNDMREIVGPGYAEKYMKQLGDGEQGGEVGK